MIKESFISIVICTRNRAESLSKYAFNSMQKLNYDNFEIIVVDDASTDNTKEVVNSYEHKFKNLIYVKNKKNKGLCYVRNLGVQNAAGEIIAFTDDDCYVDKNWLKEMAKIYERDKQVACVGGMSYVMDTKKIYNPNKKIYGCNMSFKRKIFDTLLFDTNIYFNKCSNYDEIDFIRRLHESGLKVIYSETVIANHYIKPASYRQRAMIGEPLNATYMYAKKSSLSEYYLNVINVFFVTLNQRHFSSKDRVTGSLKELKKRILENKEEISIFKQIWIYYVLLIKIPYKSRTVKAKMD